MSSVLLKFASSIISILRKERRLFGVRSAETDSSVAVKSRLVYRRNPDAAENYSPGSSHRQSTYERLIIVHGALGKQFGAHADHFARLVPGWMANQNPDRQLIVSFLALDDHRIPNLFATKSANALANPH